MTERITLLKSELGHLQHHRESATAVLRAQERSLAQGRALRSRFEELETVKAQIEKLAVESAQMKQLQTQIIEIDAALSVRNEHRLFLEKSACVKTRRLSLNVQRMS